jgi:hypothetical protein
VGCVAKKNDKYYKTFLLKTQKLKQKELSIFWLREMSCILIIEHPKQMSSMPVSNKDKTPQSQSRK